MNLTAYDGRGCKACEDGECCKEHCPEVVRLTRERNEAIDKLAEARDECERERTAGNMHRDLVRRTSDAMGDRDGETWRSAHDLPERVGALRADLAEAREECERLRVESASLCEIVEDIRDEIRDGEDIRDDPLIDAALGSALGGASALIMLSEVRRLRTFEESAKAWRDRVWSVEEVDELHRRIAILEQAIHDIVDGMDSSTLGVQYTSLDNPLQRARAEIGAGLGKDGIR